MRHEAICVERIWARNRAVKDGLESVGLNTLNCGSKALSIRSSAVCLDRGRQPLSLRGVREAHNVGKLVDVIACDDKFMIGPAPVSASPAMSVGQLTIAGRSPLGVDGGDDTEPQQHTLDCFDRPQVGLAKPDTDTFRLRALY